MYSLSTKYTIIIKKIIITSWAEAIETSPLIIPKVHHEKIKHKFFLSNVFEKCDFRESKSVTYNNNVKYFQYIEVNALWIV